MGDLPEVLGVRWFSGRGCVGLVRVNMPYEGIQYYIGPADGLDEQLDVLQITEWGARFPDAAGDLLFGIT